MIEMNLMTKPVVDKSELTIIPQTRFNWIREIEEIESKILYRAKSESDKANFKSRIKRFKNEFLFGYLRTIKSDWDLYIDYRTYLDKSNLKGTTKGDYLSAVRKIMDELHRCGKIPDITKGIRGFSRESEHRFGINLETDTDGFNEFEFICNKLKQEDLRTRAIFGLLIYQALRGIEICRLDTSDINIKSQYFMVLGKGRKAKQCEWLNNKLIPILKNYLETIPAGPLFTSISNNKKQRTGRLSTNGLRSIINKFLRGTCNIYHTSVHGFRHATGTKLLNTGNIRLAQKILRHKSPETTTKMYDDNLEKKELRPLFNESFDGVNI